MSPEGGVPQAGPVLTLQESAAQVGGHCWVERRLFAVLGAAVATAGGVRTKLVLDRLSQHAAWRAGQWWERLPVLAQVDRDALVVAPAGWGALQTADWAVTETAVLAVATRVLLPRLAVAYARHGRVTAPAADASVRRTLVQVAADVAVDWVDAADVLEDLLALPGGPAEASAALSAAEPAPCGAVGDGPSAGPGPGSD